MSEFILRLINFKLWASLTEDAAYAWLDNDDSDAGGGCGCCGMEFVWLSYDSGFLKVH